MADIRIVHGWTGPLDFQLMTNGSATDLTGSTVTLVLEDANGDAIVYTGVVSVQEAATGKVRFTPAATDIAFVNGTMRARWKVTTGSQVVYFPSGNPDLWTVGKE